MTDALPWFARTAGLMRQSAEIVKVLSLRRIGFAAYAKLMSRRLHRTIEARPVH